MPCTRPSRKHVRVRHFLLFSSLNPRCSAGLLGTGVWGVPASSVSALSACLLTLPRPPSTSLGQAYTSGFPTWHTAEGEGENCPCPPPHLGLLFQPRSHRGAAAQPAGVFRKAQHAAPAGPLGRCHRLQGRVPSLGARRLRRCHGPGCGPLRPALRSLAPGGPPLYKYIQAYIHRQLSPPSQLPQCSCTSRVSGPK
ncbi:uncharacterized protein LOC131807598 isoform X2 [Mustela lutreola]|uniref:uncharacterized protein LOC131807598 isoform X2 n=1 Tax=Mustela lutreola TaxID=9666 RepID=UPI002797C70E|nr:uncharacterized protein LOC131807598 isoform X2 [Mustela lutreola]